MGHFPDYIDKAKKMGANYFDIGKKWDSLTNSQRWKLNKEFLDNALKRGDQIYLSVEKKMIKSGSWLEKEVNYLTENGYEWINQWSLRKR